MNINEGLGKAYLAVALASARGENLDPHLEALIAEARRDERLKVLRLIVLGHGGTPVASIEMAARAKRLLAEVDAGKEK